MKAKLTSLLCLLFFEAAVFAQNRVGINTTTPLFDLDVRGTNDTMDGGELQLGTPGMTNYLRFFGGRIGDPNPFIAFNDGDHFHFVTASPDWTTYTRRITIAPNGNLGIATQTPMAKLDIAASGDGAELLRFTTERPWLFKQTNTGISTTLTLQPIHNDKALEIVSANGLNRAARFLTNDTYSKVLLVPEAGEVGIGIMEATAKLHVRSNSNPLEPQLRLTETSASDYARIKLENENDPGIFWDIAGRADSVLGESRLNFYYAYPGFTGDKVTIMGNGNVGIGTITPAERLHVVGGMRISELAGTGDRNVVADANGKLKIGTSGIGGWFESGGQVTTTLEVYVDSPSGATSSMTIDGKESNGNNFAALAIYNSTQFPGGMFNRLLLDANDIDAFRGTGATPINENLSIQGLSSGNLFLANGGGKVGIGTETPTSKLTIVGSDNNGTTASLEISNGVAQKILMDGNEIDAVGGTLYLNSNSMHRVAIGTGTPATGYLLSVDGKIIAEEIRVQLSTAWPDYVFADDYTLTPLSQLEQSIRTNRHLPGIPSAEEMATSGLHLGDMQTRMMEKIEELTLYIITLHNDNQELTKRIAALETSQNNTTR